ncbi:signal peptidase I [Burkholderiaceae bacterium DAT-1]|nr:signal peptidase I [Burkholderiaceae bacterium DAT-1]
MALVARLKGYRARGGEKALPDWAAFGFSNWIVLLSIGVLKTFVIEPMQIPSSSMRPGLVVGDFIVVNKFAYGIRVPFINEVIVPTGAPARGDVVVFRYPLNTKINYIKRLIGLPGDTVEYRNKQLSVNGIRYESQPIGVYKYDERENSVNRMQEKTPSKTYQTLNDPDQQAYNLMQLAQISMQPEFASSGERDLQSANCQIDETGFVCKVPAGHYLMLGDNRDNSSDGRYWGFVPENHLAGRAFMIWMNFKDMSRVGTMIH